MLIVTACNESSDPQKATAVKLTPEQEKQQEIIGTYKGFIQVINSAVVKGHSETTISITETNLSFNYVYNGDKFTESGAYKFDYIQDKVTLTLNGNIYQYTVDEEKKISINLYGGKFETIGKNITFNMYDLVKK